MKLLPLLRVRTIRAADATEARFRELWELRRELIDLQPGVSLDDDYRSFRSFFAEPDTRISLLVTLSGRVEGFLGWHVRALQTASQRIAIVDSDYFFVRVALRSHVVMSALAMRCYLGGVLSCRCRRAVIVGHGYPASVLSGARFAWRVCFPGDADLEPWEREAMQQFAQRYCAAPPASGASDARSRGLIRMRTLPHPPPRRSRSAETRALLERFERYNPDWSQGWGLPYLLHYSPSSIAAGGLRYLRSS